MKIDKSIQYFYTSRIKKWLVYSAFWGLIIIGVGCAVFFKLYFLFIIIPILCCFIVMVSALVVRTIYFESDCFVMTYHLVGVRSLSFKKMFNEIVDISLYGDGIRSRLWISYKPNSRVSEPYDEIQSKLFSSNSEIPAQQIDFPFEVGIGLRQFLFQIIARLESADHQISVKSYKSGKSWVYSVGVDHEVEIPAGRDTWLID